LLSVLLVALTINQLKIKHIFNAIFGVDLQSVH
jgi:hypothetical protein